MNRVVPILALALIVIGGVGLAVVGCQAQTLFGNSQGFNFSGGDMMGGAGGMMGGRGFGYGNLPNVNATPVPANQPIDRQITITARNLQFDPTRVVVKKSETVKFTIVNQDAVAHNFVSQDGNIAYTFLPANATQSVVWMAPKTAGTFTAVCTFHPGMQMQIIVE